MANESRPFESAPATGIRESFGVMANVHENLYETPAIGPVRFEVLPLGRSEEEAARLPEPVRLTVTCSPKHGPDRSVEVAARLRALGHAVTVHLAARMVRDDEHLDQLLIGMDESGVDDVFVIGGDATAPLGSYRSAAEILPGICEHVRRPRTIGIAGYPEGHPLIEPGVLDESLAQKARHADYVTTQMCFDAEPLRAWSSGLRGRGTTLPVLIGVPGKVARRRLLEMSVRVGVGPSLSFLRKQRGLRNLFGRSASERLDDAVAAYVDDPQLNIAGVHYFTFNQLVDTWRWYQRRHAADVGRAVTRHPSRGAPPHRRRSAAADRAVV
jgi:methylenetetrahydrofolate reductase (NADH)